MSTPDLEISLDVDNADRQFDLTKLIWHYSCFKYGHIRKKVKKIKIKNIYISCPTLIRRWKMLMFYIMLLSEKAMSKVCLVYIHKCLKLVRYLFNLFLNKNIHDNIILYSIIIVIIYLIIKDT